MTGYRCHTLEQYVWAAAAAKLNPVEIRRIAEANYSIDRVRWMYQEYFEMLTGLWTDGWYEQRPRENTNRLRGVLIRQAVLLQLR